MDPIRNPYSPGAGTPPVDLAGRDELLDRVQIATQRIMRGRPAKSVIMIGLRGVGKTVLLNRMQSDAESAGIHALLVEAQEDRSLPAILAPEIRKALRRLSRNEQARELARRAQRALAGFVGALKFQYGDIQVSLDVDPEPGLADNGDLTLDLQVLLEVSGKAASGAGTALALFVDELQYVPEKQLAALIAALHRMSQRSLPVVLVGAGLPQLRGRTGQARSYAERLFDFPEVGPLSAEAARQAIQRPAQAENESFAEDAVQYIVEVTRRYPYFLQEWGKHAWDVARASPITLSDARQGTEGAVAALDEGFFRVRFDRLAPSEKRYLRAMAELGAGPHRSGDVAAALKREVTSLGPTRSQLIAKGMIFSPSHGDTAFTVPLFDQFMRRIMPGDEWTTA